LWSVYWKFKNICQMDTTYTVLTNDQEQVSANLKAIAQNFSQIQSNTTCKHFYWWQNYFETVRKNGNKIWQTKLGTRPVLALWTIIADKKHSLLHIFFSLDGIAVQILVPRKGQTWCYICLVGNNQDVILN
jgi:hypothetical protein